ncbi:SRF-TF-domain-containing protein [Atractiella rhizophila]|nr:SRF-TF-domain-containing protein [Atractiella rhizophila]
MFTSQPYPENPLSAHSSLQSIHPEPKPPNGGFQYVNPAEEIDDDEEDEDDEEEGPSRKRKRGNTGAKGKKPPEGGRRSINIAYIDDRAKRHITFSKRKSGIMKKAYELSTLTGTEVMLLVVSESGLVYTYTTQKFEAMVANAEGKNMITACLVCLF